MRTKLSGILVVTGLFLLFGLAGSEDLAFAAGQAGRPLWDLILWGAVGCGILAAGVAGLNRQGK